MGSFIGPPGNVDWKDAFGYYPVDFADFDGVERYTLFHNVLNGVIVNSIENCSY